METATAFGSSSISLCCKPSHDLGRAGLKSLGFRPSFFKHTSGAHLKLSNRKVLSRRGSSTVTRASLSSSDSDSSPPSVAPLQLESPVGQFLSQILVSHPHLVPAAVDQQLEQLQTDRDAEAQKEEPSAARTDLVLYRRIAEVKANDRRKALEEILYTMVVQKFMDSNVPLIPTINFSSTDSSIQVDSYADDDEKLKNVHSTEAYEMIQNHLALILGNRLADSNSVAQISKLRVGQVYAASVMYGYFLKRIDQRFQLEQTMKVLPEGSSETSEKAGTEQVGTVGYSSQVSSQSAPTHPEVTSWPSGNIGTGGFGFGIKSSRLRNYVMSFDGETLQRYATIRSKEAVSIIEKHTEALFGKPEIVITPEGTIDSSRDEQIKLSFGGLRRLVLEAVTFGSFLWDVESYVDTRYHFVAN
ncbi:hypothetical protein Leryth_026341 [Lithospermum erythrorhizon]|nr:hypothetical protein Leryth_026341 [Lithospermum erythrorhizon]